MILSSQNLSAYWVICGISLMFHCLFKIRISIWLTSMIADLQEQAWSSKSNFQTGHIYLNNLVKSPGIILPGNVFTNFHAKSNFYKTSKILLYIQCTFSAIQQSIIKSIFFKVFVKKFSFTVTCSASWLNFPCFSFSNSSFYFLFSSLSERNRKQKSCLSIIQLSSFK